jgi:hypothetical protein
MADFIAVESGNSASGYLIANGNVYPAASGTSSLLDIPQGTYNYGADEALSSNQYYSMTDAPNRKEAKKRKGKGFRKFHIGTGPAGTGTIPDKRRPKDPRKGVEFHYDGGNPGTAGCIGYQDNAAKDALIADPNKTVTVQYVKDMDAVKAQVEQKLGHKVDWSKVSPLRKAGGGGGGGSGTHSKNRKGKKVKKANRTVLLGPKNRHTAHRLSLLEGGVQIADASTTVFVGPERLGVARVDDQTTDGSPIADGESSIMVG